MTTATEPRRYRPLVADRSGPGIGYLPGIDGLRALSIAAVLAYHLDQTWATGGYLGVEVFFVVSGFLITMLALDEHRRTGAMDRRAFWIRRARRLLPAVIVLVAGVLAYVALVSGTTELRRFRGDGVASLLYVQNWHAIIARQPYFEAFGRPSPLLHLWSLAIEEQFYLLWPLLLPAALRRLGSRRTAILTLGGAVASMGIMDAVADIGAPDRAYYGTDTRAFAILFGCALAFAWRPDRFRDDISTAPRRTLAVCGAAALVVLGWQLGHRSEYDPWTYPWGFALVDLCTLVLIVTVTHPGSPLRRMLGSPVLAAVGRRSYSLYLWHWPVVVFTRPGVDWPLTGTTALVARLVITVALAEASYRWVEQPFRDGRMRLSIEALVDGARTRRRAWVLEGAVAVLVLGLVGAVIAAPDREPVVQATASPITIALHPTTTPAPTTTTAAPTTTTTTSTTVPPPTSAAPPTTTAAPAPPPTPAPAPTTAPPPATVPDVTIVGESVTLGAAPRLHEVYGARVQIDAVEGRSFSDGVEVVEQLAAAGRLTPTVVVHMGNNGAAPAGALDRIGAAVGPDRLLVLVTVRVPRNWMGQVNEQLVAYAGSHPNAVLADWYDLTGKEDGLLTDDGVHLTPQGRIRYTDLLVSVTH